MVTYTNDLTHPESTSTTVFQYDVFDRLLSEGALSFQDYVYIGKVLVGKSDVGGMLSIHNDQIATPRAMTDSGGSLGWTLQSRPFGDNASVGGSENLNLRFPGQYHDETTGLEYNQSRFYHAGLGRYLRADPAAFPATTNLYTYAANAPVNRIDPLGLFEIDARIRWQPTTSADLRPGNLCGRDAGGACINQYAAWMTFGCEPIDCGDWRPTNVVLHYQVNIVLFLISNPNDNWRDKLRTAPRDRSINSSRSAAWHEANAHVIPSINEVAPLVAGFEKQTFKSEALCIQEGLRVTHDVGRLFSQHLQLTQLQENAFGRR
jgi:RHS repeat-associated protein